MMPPQTARLHDGAALSYAVLGDLTAGTPVMLHRPLGGSMALWGEFATGLAAAFPTILFDPRGVGLSSALPLGHTTRDMARDAIDLLDYLGVGRAHVLGVSLGGMVASWVAIDSPDHVARLVLVSTLPRVAAISGRIRRHVGPMLLALLRHGSAAEIALVRDVLSPSFRRDHPDRLREIEELVRRTPTSHGNLLALALAAARHDASAALRRVRAPTLLVFGGRDEIAGRHAQHELACDIAGAVVEIIPDAGHAVALEQPRLLAARVTAFLRAD